MSCSAPQFNPTSSTARDIPVLEEGSQWVDTFGKPFKVISATRSWVTCKHLGQKRGMGLAVFLDNMVPLDEWLEAAL